ncbi:MAG: BatD family protein, partial [Verrucomicrobiota bacterium]
SDTVTSGFDPSSIYLGESTTYAVNISREIEARGFVQAPSIEVNGLQPPEVPGMTLRYLGPQQATRIINGRATASISHVFAARPNAIGTYTMPAFSISVDGESYEVPAATLTVVEGGDMPDTSESVAMEFQMLRDKIYLGEAMPVELRLFIDGEVDLAEVAKVPSKVGDAFSISAFSDPQQRTVTREGKRSYLFTWQAVVTPVKTGSHPLDFEVQLAYYPPQSASRTNQRDPFERIFGRNSLFSMRRSNPEVLTVRTDDQVVEVFSLPEADRPEAFTGAIGQFTLTDLSAAPQDPEQGEPVELSLTINGAGNFAYIDMPELEQTDGWRVYNAEEDFEATNRYDYQGQKRFTYFIAPSEVGLQRTPTIVFNYFDPVQETYIVPQLTSPEVDVQPAPPGSRPTLPDTGGLSDAVSRGPALEPPMTALGSWHTSVQPLFTQPLFLAAQLIPLVALIFFAIKRRQFNKLTEDPVYARRYHAERAMNAALNQAESAGGQGDLTGFAAAAERALQEAVGSQIEQASASLSLAEIERLLEARGFDANTRTKVRTFLQSGEALKFAGGMSPALEPKRDLPELRQLCQSLFKA